MKRKVFLTVAAVLGLTAIQLLALGQTRIHFAKGRTSTTVSATIARGSTKCFVLGTRRYN